MILNRKKKYLCCDHFKGFLFTLGSYNSSILQFWTSEFYVPHVKSLPFPNERNYGNSL